jgi:hypothetical protein
MAPEALRSQYCRGGSRRHRYGVKPQRFERYGVSSREQKRRFPEIATRPGDRGITNRAQALLPSPRYAALCAELQRLECTDPAARVLQ